MENVDMGDSFFDSPNKSLQSKDMFETSTEMKTKYFNFPYMNKMLVFMNHPASLTTKNLMLVEVLSGRVSVFGYTIDCTAKPLKVLSQKNTGLIRIKTESCDPFETCDAFETFSVLEEEIYELCKNRNKVAHIMNQWRDGTVVIMLRPYSFPTNLQFLDLYFPFVLRKEERVKSPRDLYFEPQLSPIQFGPDVDNLVDAIFAKNCDLDVNAVAPRIVVFGPKNTGKSTLIRYLVNRVLSKYPFVCYLDTDPGQPEFTLPGTVSLNKVSTAIIGPPFCHQKDPVSTIFTGDITVGSPIMYERSVTKLMQLYAEKFNKALLFVNTMGWMHGIGLECLKKILPIINPTIVVELEREKEDSMFDYRKYVPEGCAYYYIYTSCEQKKLRISAKEMREISIISYLGKSMSDYLVAETITKVKPVCVSWDKIAVYVFKKRIQPWKIPEALNLSIVALCSVPKSAILVCEEPEYALTLKDEPENECLGFGLVRAIDEVKHLLYIVTPLGLNELRNVNAILKGSVMTPNALILNQGIHIKPLPYVRVRAKKTPTNALDNSVTSLESPQAQSPMVVYDSTDCYRRNIPTRNFRQSRKFK